MTRCMKSTILVAMTACVFAMGSTYALAWDVQQHYTNTTGQTAYDLTKILWGNWTVNEAIHIPFPSHTVTYHNGFTIIHWYGATVPAGSGAYACFNGGSATPEARVLCAYWTDAAGNFIGGAMPVLGVGIYAVGGNAIAEVRHNWASWTGTGYPPQPGDGLGTPLGGITVSNVSYAICNVARPLEELNDGLLADPTLTWVPLGGFSLSYGEMTPLDLGPIAAPEVVLLRFEAVGGGQTTTEIIQFRAPSVPTVSEWGLIILTLLLLTAGTILVARRRRVATA